MYKPPSTKLSVCTAEICSTLTEEILEFSSGGRFDLVRLHLQHKTCWVYSTLGCLTVQYDGLHITIHAVYILYRHGSCNFQTVMYIVQAYPDLCQIQNLCVQGWKSTAAFFYQYLLIKGTVSVISSGFPSKDGKVRFTTVPLKAFSNQDMTKLVMFIILNCNFSAMTFEISTAVKNK